MADSSRRVTSHPFDITHFTGPDSASASPHAPRRTPHEPSCSMVRRGYDCDAILHLESCSSTMGCLTPGKTRRVAEGEAESRREWPGVPRSAPVTWPWLELPALFVGTRTCKTWVEESFHVLRVY